MNVYEEIINDPFKQEVMLNILVDALARRGLEMWAEKVTRKPTLAMIAMALYNNRENIQITNLR